MKKCPQCSKELEDKVIECSCGYNWESVEITRKGIEANLAQLNYYSKESDIHKFKWTTGSDEGVCEYCKSMVGIYNVKDARQIVRNAVRCKNQPCRCSMLPIFD